MKPYSPTKYEAARRDIQEKIESLLNELGMFFRTFSRVKSYQSLESKVSLKKDTYQREGKKLQDFIGIRITAYFEEDVQIISEILKSRLDFDSQSVDQLDPDRFAPQRNNLIFKIPEGVLLDNPSPEV